MTEIAVRGARIIGPINWKGVPASYKGKLSAVCRSLSDCNELVKWFGEATFCPDLPILVMVPGAQPTLIPGFGFASAAELRDCAVVAWGRQSEKIAQQGSVLDYNALREKRGLMRREEADAAIREALHDRIRKHRASPVTDPFREPQYVRPNERTLFPITQEMPK